MEDSGNIWHWCRARKKVFPMSKIQSDGFFSGAKIGTPVDVSRSNISKGKQCMDDSPVRRSPIMLERNALKCRTYDRSMYVPVQNSIPEVDYLKNGDSSKSPISVIVDHISLSGTTSDTMSDHLHGDSGHGSQFLSPSIGFAGENSNEDLIVHQKKQACRLRMKRRGQRGQRGQRAALKHSSLLSDDGMKGNSDQYTVRNRETSMDASSSCSISKMVAENMQFQSRSVNGEIRNLRTIAGSDTSSSYINWPCHPPASKKLKRNRSLVSETGESIPEIENLEAKSEILFRDLHLLAEASVLVLENEQAALAENIGGEKDIRKAIFIPTGVSFLQKRVLRRARSAFKHPEPDAPKMLHNLQENLNADSSKPQLTTDNISILETPVCTEHSENQVIGNGDDEDQTVIPQVRCSKRIRSHALPSKYCDSVMQPWKRGTRL